MYDPTSILGYGAIGLGFLLAFFAYRLLGRPNIKERPIYVFEIFCLALVLIGAALQYASMNATANSSQNQALQAELSPPPGSFHRPSGAMNISNRPSVTMFSCWNAGYADGGMFGARSDLHHGEDGFGLVLRADRRPKAS